MSDSRLVDEDVDVAAPRSLGGMHARSRVSCGND